MQRSMIASGVLFAGLMLFAIPALGQDNGKELPTIAEFTEAMEKHEGFFAYYWNADTAEIFLEVAAERWGQEFLYMTSLPRGIGSNDIGIDRGQIRGQRIVLLKRAGRKAMLIEPNYQFRAEMGSPAEKRSVDEAFARSVIWAMTIVAEEDGRVLVNPNFFLTSDQAGVENTLRSARQGNYQRDRDRCTVDIEKTKNFPLNTEIEVIMTYAGQPEGWWIRSVAPDPSAVTVNTRHSFVQLPDNNYQRRVDDPRSGYGGISFRDYSTPVDQPLTQRFIARHRLVKKDPSAAVSEAVEPIVYYIDSGAPEPVRSALIEGASWWNEAFEAAGFKNGFQVKVLPEGADPLDVRYNVIQWVHRSTRGWSYGNSVVDPRTGEIIKGHVSLGSLRVRQDYLIATALTSPYEDGDSAPDELKQMALARIRQLSAHEVGHTIGLRHNYIASTYGGRASVMDYPHPLLKLNADGGIDFSEAYDVGIGEWDILAIRYGYTQFAEGTDEEAALRTMLDEGKREGIRYITDADARPAGSVHPMAHLWDNGADAAEELRRVMDVRRAGLERFSDKAIRNGVPYSELEKVLVPLYLFHRYQVEAAVKMVAGAEYNYDMRGHGDGAVRILDPALQNAAVEAILATINPDELTLPERILAIIPPPAPTYGRDRETFLGRTGLLFDPVATAETAADHSIALLLHPQRAVRLTQFHARDPQAPGLLGVLRELIDATWKAPNGTDLSLRVRVAAAVDWLALKRIMALAASDSVDVTTLTVTRFALTELKAWLEEQVREGDAVETLLFQRAAEEISRFFDDPSQFDLPEPLEAPPGSPIGLDFGCAAH